jgi:DNA-3-methyladenine glycosylase
MILRKDFYVHEDVVYLARALLGKVLFTRWNGQLTAGVIYETEAYNGTADRACHAFNGRRTARNEIMYAEGGYAYVYLCYGIHSLFNVVTGPAGNPQAVLIRAIYPFQNVRLMKKRLGYECKGPISGPGKVCKSLGIHYSHSGICLLKKDKIWIEDRHIEFPANQIRTTPRIGVHYAGKDAALPYRFVVDF